MRKRSAVLVAAALLLAVTGCSGTTAKSGTAAAPTDPTKVSGDITVLTHKTDLYQDGTLAKYAAEFNKIYPNVHVKFDAIVNYEGDVKVRMNSDNYGDVLMIPAAVPVPDYPKFFAPLGTTDEMSKKYLFMDHESYNGQVYGIPTNGNANGLIYNKQVWQQAGITSWPKSIDEFMADLQAIKTKTSSTPLYTIYHEMWPMTAWQFNLGSNTCDTKSNDNLATDTAPWAAGKELNTIDSMLYNVVHNKLDEADPTTTAWESAKSGIATGKIGTLMLASWAISQMQVAAKTAGTDPNNIGFMPFPAQVGGHYCSIIQADYAEGISIHSQHKDAARAWADWFVDKSTFAQDQDLLPTLKNAALPPALKTYQDNGAQFIQLTHDKNALVTKIDNQSEIGLNKPDYRQHIVDLARGAASGGLDAYFADLNKKWSDAIKAAGS